MNLQSSLKGKGKSGKVTGLLGRYYKCWLVQVKGGPAAVLVGGAFTSTVTDAFLHILERGGGGKGERRGVGMWEGERGGK